MFVVHYLSDKFDDAFEISCEATDLNPTFLSVAKRGCYPRQVLDGMHATERSYVSLSDQGVYVDEEVIRYVKFLPSSNFSAFPAAAQYDIVFLLNALIYVPESEQAQTIDSISSYNKEWLILSAFHQNTVKSDLQRNRYYPVLSNIEAIHNAWLDRRVAAPEQESRAGIYADWSLPEFSKIQDYEYRFGTIFRKSF